MEGEVSVEIAVAHERGQKINDRLFFTSIPEVFDFFAEWRIFWPVEAYGVSMVELVWCGLPVILAGQVEERFGLRGMSSLLTA